jgi:4-amino-4-deoxy-L-arabinose transferase-like glycosyltransferase
MTKNRFLKESIIKIIKSKQTFHFGVLTVLWMFALCVIHPFGNFPLYDDFNFSKTLKILFEEHRYQYIGFTISHFLPLVSHYALGFIFCIPFGFSHTIIRISTIFLSIIGVFYFYALIKHLFTEKLAFLCSLLLAFNPLFFILSYSYMTDVPFFVYTIISLFYYVKYFETEKNSSLCFAILFSLLATLTRQLGILLPFSLIISFLFKPQKSKKSLFIIIGCFLLNIIVFLIVQKIFMSLQSDFKVGTGLGLVAETLAHVNIDTILFRYDIILILSSLCLFPLLVIYFPFVTISFKKCALALFFILPFLLYPNYLLGTYINNISLGPLTTKDVYGFKVLSVLSSNRFIILFKCIGFITSFVFLLVVIEFLLGIKRQLLIRTKSNLFLIKSAIIFYIFSYCTLFLIYPGVSDRYLIPVIFFFTIILLQDREIILTKVQKVLIPFSLLFIISTTIAGTHDYFMLHTARWKAVDFLLKERKVSPVEFDAGYEPNGWYNYSYPIRLNLNKSWWYVDDDKYIVALTPLAGYDIIKTIPYVKWIHNYANKIYVLKRFSDIESLQPQTYIDFETILKDSLGFITSSQIVTIPSKSNIIQTAHSGSTALLLSSKTADNVLFHISDIHADDYCEIRFWANSANVKVRTQVKIFSLQYDVGIDPIITKGSWTEYKCSFFASSWISDFADNIDFKILPLGNQNVIIDDMKLFRIKMHKNN